MGLETLSSAEVSGDLIFELVRRGEIKLECCEFIMHHAPQLTFPDEPGPLQMSNLVFAQALRFPQLFSTLPKLLRALWSPAEPSPAPSRWQARLRWSTLDDDEAEEDESVTRSTKRSREKCRRREREMMQRSRVVTLHLQ